MSKLVNNDGEYFGNDDKIIELENCPRGGNNCENLRNDLNNDLLLSRQYLEDKQYVKAAQLQMKCFQLTFGLNAKPCVKCAGLFRQFIKNSLNETHNELTRLTTGLFRRRALIPVRDQIKSVLEEMDKISKIDK